jgi:hypothetical protein
MCFTDGASASAAADFPALVSEASACTAALASAVSAKLHRSRAVPAAHAAFMSDFV